MKNTIIRRMFSFLMLLILGLVFYGCGGAGQQPQQVTNSEGYEKLKALRAHEDSLMNHYKLLDAQKGIYRIPVDRALVLVAGENEQK